MLSPPPPASAITTTITLVLRSGKGDSQLSEKIFGAHILVEIINGRLTFAK